MSEEEVFLTLLSFVAFQNSKTEGLLVRRGELNINMEKLRKIFNWSQWRIRKFLSLWKKWK